MSTDNTKQQIKQDESFHTLVCPTCGSSKISTFEKDHTFKYGKDADADAVELTARIPVRKCMDCEFCFTDFVAENIIGSAIRKHLK